MILLKDKLTSAKTISLGGIFGLNLYGMVVSLVILQVSRSAVLTSVQNPMLRDLGREIWYVVTHGLMVQTIFLMIAGVLLSIGAWQSAPDSALMKWEASRKEKEAAKEGEEEKV